MELSRQRKVQLYSDNLTDFCKDNQLYLDLLKDHVDELEKMKEYDETIKQSQTDGEIHRLAKSSDPRNLAVMFTRMEPDSNGRLFTAPARPGEYEDGLPARRYEENPFCYLCSTMEQHKKHIMKTEKKIHGKKRIPYEAPAPFVPPKPPPPKPESKECLYRVMVKTGTDIKAACSAPVYITLRGEDDTLSRSRLTKKFGSLAFFFDSGSTEVFHIRGPRIGRLSDMTLAIEPPEEATAAAATASSRLPAADQVKPKKHRYRWLIETVSVRDYSLGMEYHFNVNNWLKSGRRDRVRLPPTTSAKSLAQAGRGILVTTYTGRKATSGTDCRVYISLMGAKGSRGRHELRRPVEEGGSSDGGRNIFQPGSKDVFELYVEDFGDLKGIRLELDTRNPRSSDKFDKKDKMNRSSESSRTWFVDQVIVKDIKTGQKWLFTVSEWLNEETPMREVWTVKDVHDGVGSVYTQTTLYQIVTKTGKKNFAGTDSTIYMSLFDKAGRRCDIELRDEDKSRFEKGQTDTMNETARVIDTPVKLKVSISGKGIAPDWYMDGIVVTKYLVMEEILQHLQRLQFSNKMPDGLTQDKGKILFENADAREKQRKKQRLEDRSGAKKGKRKRSDEEAEDSVDASAGFFGRSRRRASLKSSDQPSDSEDSDATGSDKTSSASDGESVDSVKSHDDFDPNHGSVKLPYAVQVTFVPQSKDQAWLKKDKTVELPASDSGKLLYRQLRLCSDNENFERIRKELLEKQKAEEEKKKKQQEKKRKRLEEQQKQSRAAAAAKKKSKLSSSSTSSSDDERSKKRRPVGKTPPSGASRKVASPGRQAGRPASSDSESSLDAFGKPKLRSKAAESYKKLTGEEKRTGKGLDDSSKRPTKSSEDQKRSPRTLNSDKSQSDRRGLQGAEKKPSAPPPEKKFGGSFDIRRADRLQTDEFNRSKDKSPASDSARRLGRKLDSGKDRTAAQDPEKDLKRSPREFDRLSGLGASDKAQERKSPLDLETGRSRLSRDFDGSESSRGRSGADFDSRRRDRLGGGVAAAASAADQPRIVVTATDGRQGDPVVGKSGGGRLRQRSFELP
uniref:PLAT domain-containing protein n=1 Tax=Macrostomum lignano TaxID=282301 RepID=A0A1I8GF23_9PLAT